MRSVPSHQNFRFTDFIAEYTLLVPKLYPLTESTILEFASSRYICPHPSFRLYARFASYSTVTDFARLRGKSTLRPSITASQ